MTKIALISDTHDRKPVLRSVLEQFAKFDINTVFHCGDVTSFETAYLMAGLHVIYCFGNGDHESDRIARMLREANSASVCGLVCETEINSKRIASTHSHLPGKLAELTHSGKNDYVFYGHTHRQKMQEINGCKVINPGSLGNPDSSKLNFAIIDLEKDSVDFY